MDARWENLASNELISKTVHTLETRKVKSIVVENGIQALERSLQFIPKGSTVYLNSSVTLDSIGLSKIIDANGDYISIRKQIMQIKDEKERLAARKVRMAQADFTVGSAQAVTAGGQIVFASRSGSQIAAHSFMAGRVLLVVGTQKIVSTLDEALHRIRDYCIDREDERLKRKPAIDSLTKILIVEGDIFPNRMNVIFVKEKLGY
jgi:L-lactate utilization protein LutC